MKKFKGFIKHNKTSLMVSLFVIILLVSIPSAYYIGKNTDESKETYLPLSQQRLSNDPFERMEQIHHRMDEMFDEFWNDPYLSYSYEFPSIRDFETFMPSIHIEHYTTDDDIIIKAKLPVEKLPEVFETVKKESQ